ncbi:TetR/AcrR family transcriptional regulator [Streptomyces sp. CRN 30]|uniref:TetR/AcrR family transcriptional regulator n=1 Tax=Streptomyces sp. CRN 30 TaxID=3075613 RepID=UPI002A7FE183|nr:TetR family transcriptional regulator [Streptomyces sp. CRN 30]
MSSTTPERQSLTERRKSETRTEIARAAARLFVRQGLRATRAEDIAQAAGIAPRTFYRYFATKEEAVAPLYAAGAQRWAEAVRDAPAGLSPHEALEHAVRLTLTPGAGVSAASWEFVRTLIRLAESSPALRKVWAEVYHTSERALAEVLADRLAAGDDNVARRLAASPRLRFVAAAAGATVRIALEHWAGEDDGDRPGHTGRSALDTALGNLETLRHLPWDTLTDAVTDAVTDARTEPPE